MLPDKLRRMPVLPKRHLYPLWLFTPAQRRIHREWYDAAPPAGKRLLDSIRLDNERRNDRDRPARTQSTRRRLTACFWEGFGYNYGLRGRWLRAFRGRPLWQGPTWMGSNRPGKPAFWRGMFGPRTSW